MPGAPGAGERTSSGDVAVVPVSTCSPGPCFSPSCFSLASPCHAASHPNLGQTGSQGKQTTSLLLEGGVPATWVSNGQRKRGQGLGQGLPTTRSPTGPRTSYPETHSRHSAGRGRRRPTTPDRRPWPSARTPPGHSPAPHAAQLRPQPLQSLFRDALRLSFRTPS